MHSQHPHTRDIPTHVLNIAAPTECGGALTPSSTEIKAFASPGYPGGYSPNERCEWIIAGMRGKEQVVLTTNNFAVDESEDCKRDQVVIYEGGEQVRPHKHDACSYRLSIEILSLLLLQEMFSLWIHNTRRHNCCFAPALLLLLKSKQDQFDPPSSHPNPNHTLNTQERYES